VNSSNGGDGLARLMRASCGGSSPWGDLNRMPICTRCLPILTSWGGSEGGGESVDQVDRGRVCGLIVIGTVALRRGAFSPWSTATKGAP
jgi:hypothetical protein